MFRSSRTEQKTVTKVRQPCERLLFIMSPRVRDGTRGWIQNAIWMRWLDDIKAVYSIHIGKEAELGQDPVLCRLKQHHEPI